VLSLRRRLAAMFGYQEEEDEKERGGDCGLWSFWFWVRQAAAASVGTSRVELGFADV